MNLEFKRAASREARAHPLTTHRFDAPSSCTRMTLPSVCAISKRISRCVSRESTSHTSPLMASTSGLT